VPDLDAALPRADFVTIHCPKTPETIGLFNAARFKHMKPAPISITHRPRGIVDEKALPRGAGVSGRLAGAGLDVFEVERAGRSALHGLPNVIHGAHVAGVTVEASSA